MNKKETSLSVGSQMWWRASQCCGTRWLALTHTETETQADISSRQYMNAAEQRRYYLKRAQVRKKNEVKTI